MSPTVRGKPDRVLRLASALTAMLTLAPSSIEAAPPLAKTPPPLEVYMGRRIAATMHYAGAEWLIRPEREREENCTRLMKSLGLKSGMTVCDMGCGNGFYALRMARQVGSSGRVLAVDIQKEMLRLLEDRAEAAGLKNIRSVLGTVSDPKLTERNIDLILCVDVYHELSHPVHVLAAMRRALAPKGRLVLVEFRAEDRRVPIKPLHKMSKKQILKEIPANGFKLVDQYDGLPWQHVMFFERDDAASGRP